MADLVADEPRVGIWGRTLDWIGGIRHIFRRWPALVADESRVGIWWRMRVFEIWGPQAARASDGRALLECPGYRSSRLFRGVRGAWGKFCGV